MGIPLTEEGDAHRAIVNFCELIKTQYGSYLKIIRIDNGTEYGGGALKAYCSGRGILIEYTAAYTPEQDGVSERSNRTIIEKPRTMIIEIIERKAQLIVAELSDDQLRALWPEIIKTAVYITNRTATLSPYRASKCRSGAGTEA
jgi:transposase InsO family protein